MTILNENPSWKNLSAGFGTHGPIFKKLTFQEIIIGFTSFFFKRKV